jgi:putative alpha-1,2-mannosidase
VPHLPDVRSGNCNGGTQGGSNAALVIADACARNLPGADYAWTLRAMLKDAEVPPLPRQSPRTTKDLRRI